LTRPPRTLYFTAEPLEYPRGDWPDSFELIGPATWSTPSERPLWLDGIDQPIVLVTCSTERLADRAILENALEGLAEEDVFVVATSAAEDPDSFSVCHGGMGITQRALSGGVPVCVIPHGRDQHDVARRVEFADAGVRLPLKKLSPSSIRDAVTATRTMTPGAQRVAKGFRDSGGSDRAAEIVESLVI
jgi:UDP:flavonoid glycosyltransferase YjiC (YdhE family)